MKNLFVKTCEQKPKANSLQRDADFLSAPEKVLTHFFCVCNFSYACVLCATVVEIMWLACVPSVLTLYSHPLTKVKIFERVMYLQGYSLRGLCI